jgi:nicotinamidase/pyrazinamidase
MTNLYGPSTALIIVDVQNDFADPDGSLTVAGGADVVPVINGQIQLAIDAGAFVVYTADWHPESTPHFLKDGGIWPVHCVGNMWGSEFHPDLVVDGPVVRKGVDGEDGYSGFSVMDPKSEAITKTALGELLRDRGITKIVVTGLATDYCVKATALDGVSEGFETFFFSRGSRPVNLAPADGEAATTAMALAGITVV